MSGQTNYPNALDEHGSTGNPFGLAVAVDNLQTALSAFLDSDDTTIVVDSTTGFPSRGSAWVDEEEFTYTGTTANSFTGVTRGAGTSTATWHLAGAVVAQAPSARNQNDLAAAVVALEAASPAMVASHRTTSTATGTVSFTSLSTRFSRFEVSVSGRQESTAVSNLLMQINGDTGANYHYLQRLTTSTAQANTEAFGSTAMKLGEMPSSTAPAQFAGSADAVIGHPSSTWAKTISGTFVNPFATSTGSLRTGDLRGFWNGTAAATRVDILNSGGNFSSGAVFRLHGIP